MCKKRSLSYIHACQPVSNANEPNTSTFLFIHEYEQVWWFAYIHFVTFSCLFVINVFFLSCRFNHAQPDPKTPPPLAPPFSCPPILNNKNCDIANGIATWKCTCKEVLSFRQHQLATTVKKKEEEESHITLYTVISKYHLNAIKSSHIYDVIRYQICMTIEKHIFFTHKKWAKVNVIKRKRK